MRFDSQLRHLNDAVETLRIRISRHLHEVPAKATLEDVREAAVDAEEAIKAYNVALSRTPPPALLRQMYNEHILELLYGSPDFPGAALGEEVLECAAEHLNREQLFQFDGSDWTADDAKRLIFGRFTGR